MVETAEQTLHDWVMERITWHGDGRGDDDPHDATCWKRHIECAQDYIATLRIVIMVLDSALWRAEHNDA